MKGIIIVILLIVIVSFYINAEWTKNNIEIVSEQVVTTTKQYIKELNNTTPENTTIQIEQ